MSLMCGVLANWAIFGVGFGCRISKVWWFLVCVECYVLVYEWFATDLLVGSSDTTEQRRVGRVIAGIGRLGAEFLDSDGLVGALDAVVVLDDDWGAIEADRVDGEAIWDARFGCGCGWVFDFGLSCQFGRGCGRN